LAFLQNKEVYKVVFAKDEKAFRTICPKKKKKLKKKKESCTTRYDLLIRLRSPRFTKEYINKTF
jgi:hypothetical protein